jgi:hypothetical protein
MADINDFFSNYLPKKLSENPGIAKEINAIYQFDIDGAGTWTVDLTKEGGQVASGPSENPGCVVKAAKADFESMLDNPSSAMMLFMQNKLKVSSIPLALSLQKILG